MACIGSGKIPDKGSERKKKCIYNPMHWSGRSKAGKSDGITKEPYYHANAIYSILSHPSQWPIWQRVRTEEDTGRPHTGQPATSKFLHLWSIEFVCVCACVCVCVHVWYPSSIHLCPSSASPHITAKTPNHRSAEEWLLSRLDRTWKNCQSNLCPKGGKGPPKGPGWVMSHEGS